MAGRTAVLIGALAVLALPAPALAQGPLGPLNDLLALGEGAGQAPDDIPIQTAKTPNFDATPAATSCAPGAKPQPSVDGRVPAGSADKGLWCNLTMVAHQGTSGGFKTLRYIDPAGHECAYYDTALLFPANAFNLNSNGVGVATLDMADPAKPVQTATLTTPAMLSPHESLNLNAKRGLLVAVAGNPATYPGYVDVYDLHADCRHPVMDYSAPIARLGHESGFSPDGKTFYAAGTAYKSITAIDLTDPKAPHVVWQGQVQSHGMTISPDGNLAYIANPNTEFGDMDILDISQIQARKADPQAKFVSRTTWDRVSIPQNAIPFTSHGKPYVLEFDEYNASTLDPTGSGDMVGAGRIFDTSDLKAPKIVSNLRLAINNPEDHKKYGSDPGAQGSGGGAQGYAAHYCNIDSQTNPHFAACSFIASGLRLFDISDVNAPKEVGYFVPPVHAKTENQGTASAYAMSMPAFIPERNEIWFTDGTSGFYVLRMVNSIAPANSSPLPSTSICLSKRRFTIHLYHPNGDPLRSARVYVDGKRVKVRGGAKRLRALIDLRGFKKKTVTVRIFGVTRSGKRVRDTRRYHTCRPGH